MIHKASKARTKWRKLWSDKEIATYPPKLIATFLKDVTSQVRIVELLYYQQSRILKLSYYVHRTPWLCYMMKS